MSGWAWGGVALGGLIVLVLLRRPLRAIGRLAVRSGLSMVLLWLLRGVTGVLGVQLGVNLLNGLILGMLGAPGLALLLMVQWLAGP